MPTKRARFYAAAVTVLCPHCSEPQPDPSTGSEMWECSQIDQHRGRTRECTFCHRDYSFPATVATVRMP